MMNSLCIVVALACSLTGASAQFLNCGWVNTLDCTTYAESLECGTDGITYPNRCYFAKQQCNVNSDLHISHDGACLTSVQTTTASPGGNRPIVDGETAVLDFFCTSLSHKACEDIDQPVCGTDGWTYKNYCEYDKERCTHRDLHINNFGPCSP